MVQLVEKELHYEGLIPYQVTGIFVALDDSPPNRNEYQKCLLGG